MACLALALINRADATSPPLLWACAALMVAATLWAHRHTPQPPPWSAILVWALVLRLLGLVGGPVLEDDHYRYLWDGYRLISSGSPYGLAPAAFAGDASVPALMQAVREQINYPDLPTLYGPSLQGLFGLSYLIAPGQIFPLQALLILLDLALLGLLRQLRASPGGLWLYAWSPLVIKEIAFTAHPDGVLALLLVLSCALRARGAAAGAGVALGLAVAAKPVALLLAPWLLWRASLRVWFALIATVVICYGGFWWQGDWGAVSLRVFAQFWVFNPLLYGLLEAVLPPLAARGLCGLIFAGLGLLIWWRSRPRAGDRIWRMPPADLVFGALLLCSPVINPWYLLWILPFAALRPSATAWTASLCVLLAYGHGLYWPVTGAPSFELPVWLSAWQILPVIAALSWDLRRSLRRRTPWRRHTGART